MLRDGIFLGDAPTIHQDVINDIAAEMEALASVLNTLILKHPEMLLHLPKIVNGGIFVMMVPHMSHKVRA